MPFCCSQFVYSHFNRLTVQLYITVITRNIDKMTSCIITYHEMTLSKMTLDKMTLDKITPLKNVDINFEKQL